MNIFLQLLFWPFNFSRMLVICIWITFHVTYFYISILTVKLHRRSINANLLLLAIGIAFYVRYIKFCNIFCQIHLYTFFNFLSLYVNTSLKSTRTRKSICFKSHYIMQMRKSCTVIKTPWIFCENIMSVVMPTCARACQTL